MANVKTNELIIYISWLYSVFPYLYENVGSHIYLQHIRGGTFEGYFRSTEELEEHFRNVISELNNIVFRSCKSDKDEQ